MSTRTREERLRRHADILAGWTFAYRNECAASAQLAATPAGAEACRERTQRIDDALAAYRRDFPEDHP